MVEKRWTVAADRRFEFLGRFRHQLSQGKKSGRYGPHRPLLLAVFRLVMVLD